MQVLLLAGGLGSRLAEETVKIPKPMVEVGGRPIIMHVMDIYNHFGHNDFLIAAGYKSLLLKQYFNNFHLVSNDLTVNLATGETKLTPSAQHNSNVSVVDTGELTMTGGRILRLREWLKDETFMVTYSDGVGNIDINAVLDFHKSHGKLATVTAVQPPARFGNLDLEGDQVVEFTEKVTKYETWINGGFFVFEPGVLDYIPGDDEPMELSPLTNIARDGELMAYKHEGFWHPMDTIRDRDYLDSLTNDGKPPWLNFEKNSTNTPSALSKKSG